MLGLLFYGLSVCIIRIYKYRLCCVFKTVSLLSACDLMTLVRPDVLLKCAILK